MNYEKVTATASRVLQLGLVLGMVLAVLLAVGLQFGVKLFTKDVDILHPISIGIPFVTATQPHWLLFFMVLTLEHLILHMPHILWIGTRTGPLVFSQGYRLGFLKTQKHYLM